MAPKSKLLNEAHVLAAFRELHPVIQKRIFAKLKNPLGEEKFSIGPFIEELRNKRVTLRNVP
ncbi:MAG TPA: hypothetical protein VIR78_14595 [Malonomonas sp.]